MLHWGLKGTFCWHVLLSYPQVGAWPRIVCRVGGRFIQYNWWGCCQELCVEWVGRSFSICGENVLFIVYSISKGLDRVVYELNYYTIFILTTHTFPSRIYIYIYSYTYTPVSLFFLFFYFMGGGDQKNCLEMSIHGHAVC